MRSQTFGRLGMVSTLTLGGGGLGQLWGATTREECVATVKAAVDAGITLLDLAPRYGDGKAEQVVGEAFGGRLPAGVRVTSKCNLGNPPLARIERILRQSIEASLRLTQLDRLDVFLLHSNIVPRGNAMWRRVDTSRFVPQEVFEDTIRPLFEKFVAEGLIGAWGVTGIGHPDAIVAVLGQDPKPAVVQVIANLLDSPGGLKFFDGPAKPREIMATAQANGVAVMGIRAVQAGALTAALDRALPANHPETIDYAHAAGYRALCEELGENPAILAHRYALSLPIDTLVLGVKNRQELAECVMAADSGPPSPEIVARIDASVA
ncbi:MAG: aldo/keto reductase [Acetobacteraceae bacterium]|nr:aldo/keto reductase [Acetobacteraceae bacterium]